MHYEAAAMTGTLVIVLPFRKISHSALWARDYYLTGCYEETRPISWVWRRIVSSLVLSNFSHSHLHSQRKRGPRMRRSRGDDKRSISVIIHGTEYVESRTKRWLWTSALIVGTSFGRSQQEATDLQANFA